MPQFNIAKQKTKRLDTTRLSLYPVSLACFLAIGASSAWAQATQPSTGSLLGTYQQPSSQLRGQSRKPPAAAPAAHKAATGGKPPVVPPHGPLHPHKPVPAKAALVKQAPPQPAPPVAPAEPEPEAKPAEPQKLPDPEKPDAAKLPRFASLRSDDVNMRAGPGSRYRIDWVYKRRELPVEIEREFDVWRWVRDADGIQGWVHQATLMGRRNFIVQKADASLRSQASDAGSPVAVLKPGVIGRIRSCEALSDWCNVQVGSYRGYLRREQFWGLLPNEVIAP